MPAFHDPFATASAELFAERTIPDRTARPVSILFPLVLLAITAAFLFVNPGQVRLTGFGPFVYAGLTAGAIFSVRRPDSRATQIVGWVCLAILLVAPWFIRLVA
jgi:hypothetical protein